MSAFAVIYRHELPTNEYRFTIDTYGFKPMSLVVENDVPVIYEIGIRGDEAVAYPHTFIWIQTGSRVPEDADMNSFVGTVQYSDGRVEHLFQIWRSNASSHS